MNRSRARAISFVCGILAIILGFSAYGDILSGAEQHDTVIIVIGYTKIVVAVVLAFVFTMYSSKTSK
ncbi:MAG TPA: hypothetical protein VL481_03705 [Verrucomicrobiae bacterium]|jgi:hypothetical protein|nr:hypothetical protein [Verrucomicrobiae bacterium]